jgi:hypothetical protein
MEGGCRHGKEYREQFCLQLADPCFDQSPVCRGYSSTLCQALGFEDRYALQQTGHASTDERRPIISQEVWYQIERRQSQSDWYALARVLKSRVVRQSMEGGNIPHVLIDYFLSPLHFWASR